MTGVMVSLTGGLMLPGGALRTEVISRSLAGKNAATHYY